MLKTNLIKGSIAVMTALAFTTQAVAGDHSAKKSYAMKEAKNIVETAQSVDALSTLVTAVGAADLAGALSADGPLTVFAPTNAAFDGLPSGTLHTLLEPENKAQLQGVLTSHVVSGKFKAKNLIKAAKANGGTAEVETLSGAKLTAILAGDKLYVKDERGGLAEVIKANVKTSNGVVHVVNRVLLPQSGHSS